MWRRTNQHIQEQTSKGGARQTDRQRRWECFALYIDRIITSERGRGRERQRREVVKENETENMSWTFEGGWQKNKGNLQLHMEKGTQKADWCGQDDVIWAKCDYFKPFRTICSTNVYFLNRKILLKMQLWGFLLIFLLPPTCVTCKSLQWCTNSFFFYCPFYSAVLCLHLWRAEKHTANSKV